MKKQSICTAQARNASKLGLTVDVCCAAILLFSLDLLGAFTCSRVVIFR